MDAAFTSYRRRLLSEPRPEGWPLALAGSRGQRAQLPLYATRPATSPRERPAGQRVRPQGAHHRERARRCERRLLCGRTSAADERRGWRTRRRAARGRRAFPLGQRRWCVTRRADGDGVWSRWWDILLWWTRPDPAQAVLDERQSHRVGTVFLRCSACGVASVKRKSLRSYASAPRHFLSMIYVRALPHPLECRLSRDERRETRSL
jgi:hypothetical protein